jgi:hypothetical protein
MTTLEQSWQTVIDLGQQMQQKTADEEWSSIAELAIQRHKTVLQHFDRYPVCPERAGFYTRNLNLFLQQEQQLKQVVELARKKAIKGVASINQGRKAVSAYRNSTKPA